LCVVVEETQSSSYLGAVRGALSASIYSIRRAWSWAPGQLLTLIITNVVLAVTPAAQVVSVAALVNASGGTARDFLLPLLALTALVGVGQVIGDASNMNMQRLRGRLRTRYQDELMRTVAALPPQRLATAETNALIQACRTSLMDMGQLAASVISSATSVVTAALLCVTVWNISPLAGVLVIAALIPTIVVFAWEAKMQDVEFVPYGEWSRRSDYSVEQLVTQRTGTELATLGSGRIVAATADASRTRAESILDRILVLIIRASSIAGLGTAVLLGAALTGIVLHGSGGAGIAAGIVGVLAGLAATRSAGFSFGDLMSYAPKIRAYRRFVMSAPAGAEQVLAEDARLIEVDGLTVSYPGSEKPTVDQIDIRAAKGEVIALVGVNGAGKTTTINAILGLLDHDAGRVRIDGVDLDSLPRPQRLGYFGLLSQEFGRYEFTVRDTVRLGRPDGAATDEEIWRALDSAHSGDIVRGMKDGLDAQLGQQFGGTGLSGGQWQRLALARIHLRNAAIWILDEPTSAIDAEAEEQIFAELQRTKANRITIVVSHRAWTLKNMDQIYVFDEGRIIEKGSYESLLADGGRFAQIFAEQVG